MSLTRENVYTLAIGVFGVTPSEEQVTEWLALDSLAAVVGAMVQAEVSEVAADLAELEGEDFVAAVTALLAGDNVSAERQAITVEYFTNQLAEGATRAEVLANMVQALNNRTDEAGEWQGAQERIASDIPPAPEPEPDPDPGVPGETFMLTPNADRIEGTANNDEFVAPMGTINFVNGNTLNTGDVLNGNGGTNTLTADLINDAFITGAQSGGAVMPTTSNIQNVIVNAIDGGNGDPVVLNASRMLDVVNVWSKDSNADLVIQDITTKTSNDGVRNTEALTFRMDHTSNANSTGQASNLTVYFDENYLLSGEVSEFNIEMRIVNPLALANDGEPLEGFTSVTFTVGDQEVLVDISEQTTYAGIAEAINAELAALGISGVEATVQPERNAIFTDDVQQYSQGDLAGQYNPVRITSTNLPLETGPITESSDVEDMNTFNTWVRDAFTEDSPVTTNLELYKVGRGSEGGNALIGGKSQSESSQGIPVFNIDVLGGDDKPSNLGWVGTTNNALREVNIASNDSAHRDGDDTWASLTVRNGFGTDTAGVNGGNPFRHTDIDTINANAFLGDLTLGGAQIGEMVAARLLNVNEFTATGGGDVEYWGEVTTSGEYSYTTGSGDDTIDMLLGGNSLNTIGDELSISTGAGNDVVNLSGTPASQQTMAELENIHVDTGSGDDQVFITGGVRANVDAGSGNDFVVINGDDGNGGEWTFGNASGPQTFQARVLYQAELTVTFAGFESTVTIPTDANGNYVATQLEINAAIRDAIESHPDLVRLLTVSELSGTRAIEVEAIYGGQNALTIDINQPNVVASNPGAGEVAAPSNAGNLNALIQGLIDTTAATSANFTNGAADVASALNAASVAQDGTNGDYLATDLGGSTNGTGNVNFSVVNMGPGAEDLVVFDSNVNSANVLQIDGQFDHVSVVNFFDNAPQNVTDVNQVGNHALDFTAFLGDQVSPSGSASSATGINITLNAPHSPLTGSNADFSDSVARANSVNMLGFDETVTDSISFADLNATNLVQVLNGATGAPSVAGGLSASSLNAAASTTNLVGNTQSHIVMVENTQNPGEYKVFSLTSTVDATTGTTGGNFDTGAELLGTLDFGQSINFGLVGNDAWETNVANLIAAADDRIDFIDNFSFTAENVAFEAQQDAEWTSPEFDLTNTEDGDTFTVTVNGDVEVLLTRDGSEWVASVAEGEVPEEWAFDVNEDGTSSTLTITNTASAFTVEAVTFDEAAAYAQADGELDLGENTDSSEFIAEATPASVTFDLAEPAGDFYADGYTFQLNINGNVATFELESGFSTPAQAAAALANADWHFGSGDFDAFEIEANGSELVITHADAATEDAIMASLVGHVDGFDLMA